MEAKNFTLKTKVVFTSNVTSYDKQPVITLINDNSITSGKFISLYRVKKSDIESASITAAIDSGNDGFLGMSYGDGYGLTSATGDKRIKSRSITTMSESLAALATTGETPELTITLVSNTSNDINVLVEEKGYLYEEFTFENMSDNGLYNFIGNGFRPFADGLLDADRIQTVTPDGTTANSSLVLQYMYNAMEASGDTFTTSGLTGIYDWSGNSNSASVFGQAAGDMSNFDIDNAVSGTVTGHTWGPIEGGFKLDGASYIKTTNPSAANLFNVRDESTSGFTIMTHVKFNSTADTDVVTLHDGTDVLGRIKLSRGAIVFDSTNQPGAHLDSISAGYIETEGNPAVTASVPIGKWMHLAATVDSSVSGSITGSRLYINGVPSILASTNDSTTAATVSADMHDIPVLTDIDTEALIGINTDNTSNALVGTIGLTRIFNRPLSEAQIFENFITSIPGSVVINEINIA